MDATNAAPSPTPPARPPSVEITPDEFDYYLKQAHEMRADAMTAVFGRCFATLARLFAPAKRAPRQTAPVLVKPVRSRTA